MISGVDECLVVNHLGHFQLTTGLLPLLIDRLECSSDSESMISMATWRVPAPRRTGAP